MVDFSGKKKIVAGYLFFGGEFSFTGPFEDLRDRKLPVVEAPETTWSEKSFLHMRFRGPMEAVT